MPKLNPSCIVSFSSEDPNHPASNLLKSGTYRKWKCRDEGEKEAVVIFKFEKAETITAISIANENSAFIEIFVARSGTDPIKYESIVSQSQLMSPAESRNGEGTGSVKMFNSHLLNKVIAAEKWDIVKIVCCQPFNSHVQYGLSFIEFVGNSSNEDQKPKIGGFGLRKPLGGSDDEDFDPMPVGSLFSKIKRNSDGVSPSGTGGSSPLSTGAAIRQAATSLATAAVSSSETKVKELLRKRKLDLESSAEPEHLGTKKQSYESPKASPRNGSENPLPKRNTLVDSPIGAKQQGNGSPSAASSTPQGRFPSGSKLKKRNDSEGVGSSANSQSSPSGTSRKETDRSNLSLTKRPPVKPKTSKHKQRCKSFSKLFEGVVFVMSGFENPYRSELRNKAVDMGARFKGDWDATCTHLLCAFVNTPKFRQVKSSGRGKIVKKEWVEASHAAKCRFPWRRYCLDRDDKGTESEDEIYAIDENRSNEGEEILVQSTATTAASGENDEEENESSREMTMTQTRETAGEEEEPLQLRKSSQQSEEDDEANKKKKRKRVRVFESDDEEEVEEERKEQEDEVVAEKECEDYYDADTDVDEDKEKGFRRTNDSSPEKKSNNEPRNDFFQDCVFLLHPYDSPPLNPTQRDQIEQIISRHKGKLESELTCDLEFIVTESEEWLEDFAEALSENPNLCFVRSQWILDCGRKSQKISPEPFLILPN